MSVVIKAYSITSALIRILLNISLVFWNKATIAFQRFSVAIGRGGQIKGGSVVCGFVGCAKVAS